jgi:HEAT repeat protein
MKRQTIVAILVVLSSAFGVLIGCHAKPDDPAGQAEELADPVRRENAINNLQRLYSSALAAAQRQTGSDATRDPRTVTELPGENGQPARPGPKAIVDASIEALVRTYQQHPNENPNSGLILDLLREMRDVRALPAFIQALEWRAQQTEEQAIMAARAIEQLEVPEDKKGDVITALTNALDRVSGSTGVDNRMRIHFIRTLGAMHDNRSTPILTKVALRLTEDQNFLINRMAAEELGNLGDPAAVPAMVKALFLFAVGNPAMRMNDVGSQALVQIGRPAYEPLTELLREGGNPEVERIAQNYIRAISQRNAEAAALMDPRSVVIEEACFALGQLGFREATDPLFAQIQPLTSIEVDAATEGAEANRQLFSRALSCTTSAVQLNRAEGDTPRLRQALIDVFQRIPESWPPEAPGSSRAQLLAAMMHTYDAGLLDFLHQVAADREGLPDFRVMAVRSYAFLAARGDVQRIRTVIESEPAGGAIRAQFDEVAAALDVAQECDQDLACYVRKLGDSNPTVVRKAAYMVGRFGRGDAAALTALIEHIDHADIPVRGDVLYAIDWVATNGSAEAIAAIERVRTAEEGRSSWEQVKSVAMAVRARLQARSAAGAGS